MLKNRVAECVIWKFRCRKPTGNIYAMYIQRNHFNAPNGKEYKTTLLCEKYREGKKVKTKFANSRTRF